MHALESILRRLERSGIDSSIAVDEIHAQARRTQYTRLESVKKKGAQCMTVLHTSNGAEVVSCIEDALGLINPAIADYIREELDRLSEEWEATAEELAEVTADYEGLSEDYHNTLLDIMEEAEAGLALTDAKRLDRSEVRETFRNVKHLCYVNL